MSTETLVLNRGYEPHDRLPWEKAMALLLCDHGRFAGAACPSGCRCGKAEVLEEHGRVYTVNADFPVPAVIRLLTAVPRGKRGIRFNRENLYARDEGRCQYCGRPVTRKEMTFEHVIPRSQGGLTRWENIVIACVPCNQRKANRTPEEARMRLLRPPRRPAKIENPRVLFTYRPGMPRQWSNWLASVSYWHGKLDET